MMKIIVKICLLNKEKLVHLIIFLIDSVIYLCGLVKIYDRSNFIFIILVNIFIIFSIFIIFMNIYISK